MKWCGGMRPIPAAPVLTSWVSSSCGFGRFMLVTLCLACFVSACQTASPGEDGTVTLWVTKDYGSEALFAGMVEVKGGQSVLALLQEHLTVKTAYGGRFVTAISGWATSNVRGEERDWFFSVNGITAHVGAADYQVCPRDTIWWDYRPWGGDSFTPAVIGAWPQPFLTGYRGGPATPLILYGEGASAFAEQLATYLRQLGVSGVQTEPYRETFVINRQQPTLVIARWEELAESRFWQGLAEQRQKSGWLAMLTADAFHPLDEAGITLEPLDGSVGAILATGTGLGDARPLWLVTALDQETLGRGVEVMVEQPQLLARKLGVLIVNGQIVELPVR